MTITMNDSHIKSITQIKGFLKGTDPLEFKATSRKERNQWIDKILAQFRYFRLRKKDKGIIREYIKLMTGLSKSQLTRLIGRKKKFGNIWIGSTKRHCFSKKYTPKDIALLVKTDNLHKRLSGPATKEILRREYELYGKKEYRTIKDISSSHIYNLRETRQYRSHSLTIKKTSATQVSIGKRKKPQPQGKPGYLRVDSAHQGDLGKRKGVYHINIVDEITQWEILGAVEKISERYLAPLLEDLITQHPFVIHGFHSDNGSEFINKVIAQLLNKLLIEQTKSRARHCNDNALVEGKNGSIIRKHLGYVHIPQRHASVINQFYKEYLNIYLNYHRPCGFATVITDKKGKRKKVYKTYLTPYERLKSLENAQQYLKKGITFEILDKIAYDKSDNEFTELMQKAKDELFENFKQVPQEMMTFITFISGSYVN